MDAKFSLPSGCGSLQVGFCAPHPMALPFPSLGTPRHCPGQAVRLPAEETQTLKCSACHAMLKAQEVGHLGKC